MNELTYQPIQQHHQLPAHRQIVLFEIASKMVRAGLPENFVAEAIRTGLAYEGVADLIVMWNEENEQEEQDEIIANIQDLINDCSQHRKEELPYIKFNDLDAIAQDIRAFKDSLLQIVEESGGITQLAEKAEMPQPSLSRFFNSNAMPHRATLLKIAKALNLDGVKISPYWIR